MMKKLKNNIFLRNSLLYTIGSMITPAIGLIMIPIYTDYLSPAEYGIMTTVQALVGMLQVFLLLSLDGSVNRFFFDFSDDKEKQKEYLGSIFIFVLVFSTVVSIILLAFKNIIGNILFGSIPITPFYYLLIGISLVNSLLALPMALFRAQEKAQIFVIIHVIKALFVMILTIFLLKVKGAGAESALVAQFGITTIIVLITYLLQFRQLKLSFNINFIKQSLLFSLPLLPHVASGWIITSSDRIILEKYVDIGELGIYALAVQVSMVLSLFYTSVNNAVIPRYTKLRKEGHELQASKLLRIFFYLVLIVGILSIPIAMTAIKLLTSTEYYGAIWLIPFLLFGQIIKGLYYIPVAKLFYSKRTKAIATSSTLAATINLIINLFTISFIGLYGALISTIVSELSRLSLIYRASKKAR